MWIILAFSINIGDETMKLKCINHVNICYFIWTKLGHTHMYIKTKINIILTHPWNICKKEGQLSYHNTKNI